MSGAPYIVWSPEGTEPPVRAHQNHGEAHAAAAMMAKKFPGQRFMVMARSGKVLCEPTSENIEAVQALVGEPL